MNEGTGDRAEERDSGSHQSRFSSEGSFQEPPVRVVQMSSKHHTFNNEVTLSRKLTGAGPKHDSETTSLAQPKVASITST